MANITAGLTASLIALTTWVVNLDITRTLTAEILKIKASTSKHGVEKAEKQPKDKSAAIEKPKASPCPVLDMGIIFGCWDNLVSMWLTYHHKRHMAIDQYGPYWSIKQTIFEYLEV